VPDLQCADRKLLQFARPSGYRIRFGGTLIHPARDQLAMDLGFLQKCAAVIIPPTESQQMSLL
jgi:hypothetical protein